MNYEVIFEFSNWHFFYVLLLRLTLPLIVVLLGYLLKYFFKTKWVFYLALFFFSIIFVLNTIQAFDLYKKIYKNDFLFIQGKINELDQGNKVLIFRVNNESFDLMGGLNSDDFGYNNEDLKLRLDENVRITYYKNIFKENIIINFEKEKIE